MPIPVRLPILMTLLAGTIAPAVAAAAVAAGTSGGSEAGQADAFLPREEVIALIGTGLGAGMLGGLLGIGGSIIMIPVLTLVFRHDQHLSQAAAMIVNVVVAVASFTQHHRRRAIPWPVVRRMIPAAIVAIIAGVVASNAFEGTSLKRFFGVFLVFIIVVNVQRLITARAARRAAVRAGDHDAARAADEDEPDRLPGAAPTVIVAAIIGFAAGLLGIGGGVIAEPLIQRVLGLPLRACIATSATLMCLTAPVGAGLKNLTLGSATMATESLLIAGVLAPTAILGSLLGARLTHVLPIPWIRAALIFLLTWAAMKFLGLA